MVLSNTVQLQDWDGRYSQRNKEWAKTIPNDNPETVRCGYALNSHPAVLDGFIDLVRDCLLYTSLFLRKILILPFVHGTAISRVNTLLSAI